MKRIIILIAFLAFLFPPLAEAGILSGIIGGAACTPTDFAPHNMTSAVLPTPYVAADSGHFGIEVAYMAFDGGLSTGQYTILEPSYNPAWVSLDIGSGNSYKLYSYKLVANTVPEPTRSPSAWSLQGSNDNSSWTTVDTESGQTGWGSGEGRTFVCSTYTTAYRYFRIYVTANNGDSLYTDIGELYFYRCP